MDISAQTILSVSSYPDHFPPVDVEEMNSVEEVAMAHPQVLEEIHLLELPAGYQVFVDPWMYGTDTPGENRQLWQCYMYLTTKPDHPENNFYSVPLDFSPVFDARNHELIRIDRLPTGADETIREKGRKWQEVEPVEYAVDLMSIPMRSDLKPLHISQPEGPSFDIYENRIQ